MGTKYANSYSPLGGWYLIGVPPPYVLFEDSGADHGSPYTYDAHVPLLFYGLPFQPGTYRTSVEPVDMVATLASLLGFNAPSHAVGRVLTESLLSAVESSAGEAVVSAAQPGTAGKISFAGGRSIMPQSGNSPPKTDLGVSLAGIHLKNPIIAASGTFGYGVEFEDVLHLDKLGGFVVKGLSKEPMIGNPPPRLYETPAGMLNAIGLQNIGARAFVDEKLPKLRELKDIVVFANVFGYTRQDYETTIQILNEGEGIAAYELNVSCPNTAHGGIQFGSDPRSLEEVVSLAKRVAKRPLIVKLSPNVTSIAHMAKVAQDAGADAISLINTFVAMAIDAETRKPRIANITAGLSGPAIKPIALRWCLTLLR